jgi:hypothetical protein
MTQSEALELMLEAEKSGDQSLIWLTLMAISRAIETDLLEDDHPKEGRK